MVLSSCAIASHCEISPGSYADCAQHSFGRLVFESFDKHTVVKVTYRYRRFQFHENITEKSRTKIS